MRGSGLTALPVREAVWRVTWPMIALGLIRSLYLVTDTWWVGRLGDAPLAAMGGAAFGWWIVGSIAELPANGAHSLVARLEGAGRRDRMDAVLWHALTVGGGIAAALALLVPAVGLYFDAIGFAPGTAERVHGEAFLRASLLGALPFTTLQVVMGVFRGLGETRLPMWIVALTAAVNAAVDPLLIHGLGPVPPMGIAGAAWATAVATTTGTLLGVVLLRRRGLAGAPPLPEAALAGEVVRIGLPLALTGVGFSLVYVVLGRMIVVFGTHQVAAMGVGHRLESFAFLSASGWMVGSATMVGQHLGAGSPARAAAAAREAAFQSCVAMTGFAVLTFALAEPLVGAFTDDPVTLEAGVLYLRIQTLAFVPLGAQLAWEGAFTGAGDTVPTLIVDGTLTAARIPLAFVGAHVLGLGVTGIWLALIASTGAKAVVMGLWLHRRRWFLADPG